MVFIDNDSGAFDMRSGDIVIYTIDGRRGVVTEFLQDGDACIIFDDGKPPGMVKWNHLILESKLND